MLAYAGRPVSASPAVGYAAKHNAEQKQLIEDAFADKLQIGRNGPRALASAPRRHTLSEESRTMRIEVKVPQLPESVAEATLVNWHKKPGEAVKRDENLIDIETDKVVLELPAPGDGVLVEIMSPDGSTVTSNDVIAVIDTEARPTALAAAVPTPGRGARGSGTAAPAPHRAAATPARRARRALPAARKMMADQGVDPAHGDRHRPRRPHHQGRRHRRRSQRARSRGAAPPQRAAPSAPAPKPAPPVPTAASRGARPEQRVPMSRLRARVAERLVQSQSTAAILTTFNEVNMQPVIDLRNRYKDRFEKEHGVKLGFMGFFVKAAVHALKKYPLVNASIDGTDIVYHGYFDIGIAVGSPRGLVVPILRDADQLSIAEIEKTDRRIRQARAGRQADGRGADRRHVHDQQRRRVRLDAVDADHQSAAVGDPRRACDQGARGRRERPGRRAADELPRAVVRPPDHRRPRGGAVAGRDQGSAGRSGAAAAGPLKADGRRNRSVRRRRHRRRPRRLHRRDPRAQLGFATACIDDWTRADGKPALGRHVHERRLHPVEGAAAVVGELRARRATRSPSTASRSKGLSIDVAKMLARKDKVVAQNNDGILYLFKKNKIAFFHGRGAFAGKDGDRWRIDVDRRRAPRRSSARHVIVATGSKPRALPGVAFDNERVLDNEGALAIPDVPKRLGVVGAGVIGLEMGSVWRRLGVEVTILEALPAFLGAADEAVAKEAQKVFAQAGPRDRARREDHRRCTSARTTSPSTYTDADGQGAERRRSTA